MRTYRVSYRIVPDSQPTVSIIFTYSVSAYNHVFAEQTAYNIMADDVQHMLGVFDADWLKRTTISRVK